MKKLLLLLIIISVAHQVLPQKGGGSPNVRIDKKYEKLIEQGRKLVTELIAKETIPGFSIALIKDGKVLWSEGFGFADLETRMPATEKTRFRIGSVSKPLTATAAAKLYELGALDLDAPIQRYLPNFPKKDFDLTSRQLLGHLAGIRHYKRDEFINRQRYDSVSDSLKIFQDDPLLHQPGTKYLYSSRGYVLLSAVIESAAKQEFLSYMQDSVFPALKMMDTSADDSRKIIENRTRFYAKTSDNKWNNEIFTDNSDRWAAGGFVSNAEDLAGFGSQSLNDGYLTKQTRSLMFTSQKLKDGKETGVGLGWRIGKDSKGRTIYHHGGESVGGRAFLIVYPESKIVLAMMCNLTFARFAEGEAERISELFMGQ